MQISLVATVYNEVSSIQSLLDSIAKQTRLPDEMVIVDGGSTDGTVALMQRLVPNLPFILRVISSPGLNIAQGRNMAIANAAYPVVAVTDAGVFLDPHWLEALVAPFEGQNSPDVVSGFFSAAPQTHFEAILGAITLPGLTEIDAASFCPSSRSVAFTRKAWERVGGYPEWLDYCEDLIYDFGLYDAGFKFVFVPEALVYFRPRPNVRSFWRQYYRYARGDGKAGLYAFRHLLRYGTYAALFISLILTFVRSPWWLLLGVAVLAVLSWEPVRRLNAALRDARLVDYLYAIVLRIIGDVAKMCGYPAGLVWRLQGNAPQVSWPRRRF